MTREILGGKIHSAHVTQVNLEYEGSCAIDEDLLDLANIRPWERVHVYNMNSGVRFDTYAIPGKRGSGVIGLNGAAARLGQKGDRVIIVSFVQIEEEALDAHKPAVVVVDEKNRPIKHMHHTMHRKP